MVPFVLQKEDVFDREITDDISKISEVLISIAEKRENYELEMNEED